MHPDPTPARLQRRGASRALRRRRRSPPGLEPRRRRRPRPGTPRHATTPCWLLSSLLLAAAARGGTGGAAPAEALAGRVIWKGAADALAEGPGPEAFAFSPAGSGFLYTQGAPWPRLMLRSAGGASPEPAMVSSRVPLPSLPPRFSPAGDAVYFTALDATELPRRRAGRRALQWFVARADLRERRTERLYPARGSREDAFAVLLDVHPQGGLLLAGAGTGLRSTELRAERLALELLEIPARGGPPRPLPIRLTTRSFARYSRSGRWIEYTPGDASDAGAAVRRYDRQEGRHLPEDGTRRGDLPRRAGDLDVRETLLPHKGSFSFDDHLSFHVARPGAAGWRPLRFSDEVLEGLPAPPRPVSFHRGRGLLLGGLEDRRVLVVADVELPPEDGAEGLQGEAPPSGLESPFAIDPRGLEGTRLAAAPEPARPFLERLGRSLREAHAEPVRALEARLLELGRVGAASGIRAIRVWEELPARLRVERFLEDAALPPPGPQAAPEEAATAGGEVFEAGREVLATDGRRFWTEPPQGGVTFLDQPAFARELNRYSLFRLLLDPAGLADPHLRFGEPREAGAPGGQGKRWILPASYADGYRAELHVEEREGGLLLPVAWISPLRLPSHRLWGELGAIAKERSVTFDAWKVIAGRRVPGRVGFAGGAESFVLELQELAPAAELDPRLFAPPAE